MRHHPPSPRRAILAGMNRPTPIPLRPDYGAIREAAMTSLCRAGIAAGLQALEGSGVRSTDLLRMRGWGDDQTAGWLMRAPQTPATMANTAALTTVAAAVLDSLKGLSAGAELLSRGHQVSFGRAASITLPTLTPPANLVGFVGDGAPYPLWQLTSSLPTMSPYKFGALIELTREMLESSAAEDLVRMALTDAAAVALDRELFSTTAPVAGTRPGGLLNGITPLTPTAAGGVKTDAMVDDIAALAQAVAPYARNAPLVLVTSLKESVEIAFRSLEQDKVIVLTSGAVPAGTVIMVAPLALVSGIGTPPEITSSAVAAVHEDTNPLPIVSDVGVVSHPLRSWLQTDTVGIKLRMPLSWALRTSGAVAFMSGVNW
jgi:Phage capsid family